MAQENVTKTEENSGTLGWFLVGAAIGVVCGVLYAPKSGRETRDIISGTTRDAFEAGKNVYEKSRLVVDDAASLFERGRKLAGGDRPAHN